MLYIEKISKNTLEGQLLLIAMARLQQRYPGMSQHEILQMLVEINRLNGNELPED